MPMRSPGFGSSAPSESMLEEFSKPNAENSKKLNRLAKRLREMDLQMFIYPNVDIVHWGYKDFGGNYDKWLRQSFNKNQTETLAAMQKPNSEGLRIAS